MKKLLLLLLLSLGIIGCASLELEATPSSDSVTEEILALGLTHTENLSEARKLSNPHMVAVVVGKLTKIEDDKNKSQIDTVEAAKYAEMVIVSNNKTKFTGPEISDTVQVGLLLAEVDYQDYFLQGLKGTNDGLIQHQLHLTLTYNSSDRRNYFSASLCDKWQRCDGNEIDVTLVSSDASNCTSSSCDYSEVVGLNLSDEFLRSNIAEGFSMNFNSKKETNKITFSSAYLKGYLKVAK